MNRGVNTSVYCDGGAVQEVTSWTALFY